MKYRSLLVMILIFYLCCACTNEDIESENEISFFNSYTYPPDDENFALALKEAGLADKWYIRKRPGMSNEPGDYRAIHRFSSDLADCIINARYDGREVGVKNYNLQLSLGYKTGGRDTPNQDYIHFEQEELPKIWALIGYIVCAPEEVDQLREECMSYFNDHRHDKPPIGEQSISWEGSQGNVRCTVFYNWNQSLRFQQVQQYVLTAIDIDRSFSDD